MANTAIDSEWETIPSQDSEWETVTDQPTQESSLFDVPGNALKDVGGILETGRRVGQGVLDLPSDIYQSGKGMMQGKSFSETPIGQDVQTIGNTALDALPHGVTDPKTSNLPGIGQYRIEPGSIFRQYQDLAAQPLKAIPGKIGDTMKQAYPGNPLIEHPVNSALALAPLAKPLFSAVREIPAIDEGLNKASNSIRENVVAPNSRRTLGKFPMKMPVDEANQVGLDAMDQGIIKNPITNPLSSSPKAMLGRVADINDSLGENIGAFLKGQGEGLNATRAMQELDQVEGQFMHDPAIVAKVRRAKDLISRNSTQPETGATSSMAIRSEPAIENQATGFKSIPAGEEKSTIPNGFGRAEISSVDNVIDPLTAQPDFNRSQSKPMFGKSREVSTPKTQLVGTSQDIQIPGNKTIVQKGGSGGINWTGKQDPQAMGFSEANKLKSLFQKKVNYFSDAASQEGGKAIAGNFTNSIDTQLDDLTAKLGNREGMDTFRSDKKMFGSTRKMEDALTGQVNRDARNMPVSLPTTIVGAAAGGLKGLVYEWTKRYGSATAASMANDVSKALANSGSAGIETTGAAKMVAPAISQSEKKTPSREQVKQFLDQANGNRKLARELAKKAGFSW